MRSRINLFCFVLGAGCSVFLSFSPSAFVTYGAVVVLVLCCASASLHWLAAFIFGAYISFLSVSSLVIQQLPSHMEDTDYLVDVRILSIPEQKDKNTRFVAELVQLQDVSVTSEKWLVSEKATVLPAGFVSRKLRLSWFKAPPIEPNQVWRLKLRLKRPRGFVNPGGFDYQAWLLSQTLFATGYVRQTHINQQLVSLDDFSPIIVQSLRFALVKKFFAQQERFPHHEKGYQFSSLLRALMLGDTSTVTSDQWEILQNTGTIHLMAISGLHVGLVATFSFVFCLVVIRMFGAITLGFATLASQTRSSREHIKIVGAFSNLPEPLFLSRVVALFSPNVLAALFSSLVAFVYSALAGFSIPTQRALILVVLANLAIICGRKTSIFHLLIVAAAIIVLNDPFTFLHRGFWLSFSAVAILIYAFSNRIPDRTLAYSGNRLSACFRMSFDKFFNLVKAQWVIFLGLFVPLALLGLPTASVSPIANLIAVPVVSTLVVPAVLLAAVLSTFDLKLAHFTLHIADQALAWLWCYLEWIEKANKVLWGAEEASFAKVLCGVIGVTLLLAPRPLSLRYVGVALCILYISPSKSVKPPLNVTILDVGQGLAIVVETPNHSILYDTGAYFSATFDIGSRVISPYLRSRGIRTLDQVIVSHGDNDHAGGLAGVLNSVEVDVVISGEIEKLTLPSTLSRLACMAGQTWVHDGVKIDVLWPDGREHREGLKGNLLKSNDRSCVLLITYGTHKFLLMGDVEENVEQWLLKNQALPEKVSVVVAPHHGSKSSSSRAFVEQISPRFVAISAGYKNRYRHPDRRVVKRYTAIGSHVINTAEAGAISFTIDKNGELRLETARERISRLWYDKRLE